MVQLGVLSIVLGTLTFILNFWLLSKAGASTYSPLLHSPSYILKSVFSHFLVSGVIVYAAYIILIFPESNRIVPLLRGIVAGGIISAIYSVLLAGANAAGTLSRTKREEKERFIRNFLAECNQLKTSATGAVEADTDTIEDAIVHLTAELSKEPMSDASEVESQLNEWQEAFQQYNTGGQRKMVGATANSPSKMDKTWAPLYEQYQFVRKKLSDMQTSAFSSVTNG
jgi:gas vesicle protein